MKHVTKKKKSMLLSQVTRYMFRGFTLVELVVTVGIFALISTVILTRNSRFDEEVLLSDLAYDVALSARKAQSYGINVRVSNGQFDRSYGVYFTEGTTTYQFFVDSDDDGFFDDIELLETYTLGRGAIVNPLCNLDTAMCNLGDLTVMFKRPNPDAIINQGDVSRAAIGILSPRGGQRYVIIESTGQFSIQKENGTEGEGEGEIGI